MTDREIIDCIKKDIIEGNTADLLTLEVFDKDTKKRYFFGADLDDMMQVMFDYSLTKTIVGMNAIHPTVLEKSKAYNGNPYPIVGYLFVIGDSDDHQTNISPTLMKFLEVVMNIDMLDRLAFPMGRGGRIGYETESILPRPYILSDPYNDDPWETLERYLAENCK